jgi:hypothetical protein
MWKNGVCTGADPGFNSNSAPTNPNYCPFGNTSEADVVSPEVEIGGCRTQVSTTRGNKNWI